MMGIAEPSSVPVLTAKDTASPRLSSGRQMVGLVIPSAGPLDRAKRCMNACIRHTFCFRLWPQSSHFCQVHGSMARFLQRCWAFSFLAVTRTVWRSCCSKLSRASDEQSPLWQSSMPLTSVAGIERKPRNADNAWESQRSHIDSARSAAAACLSLGRQHEQSHEQRVAGTVISRLSCCSLWRQFFW